MPRPLPDHVREATGGETEAIREHILDAAYRVIATRGLAGASTRAIAIEAEVGAGTLYNYFDNRLQLLARAMLRRMHLLAQPIGDLPERAGRYSVAANLRYYASQISATLDELVPLGAAAFSDPELLSVMRAELANGESAQGIIGILNRYLLAEQRLGRISATADYQAGAAIVFRICHDHAFHRYLHGDLLHAGALTREIDFIAAALTVTA
jgi:AcrR family transcriptional regulator